MTPDEFQELLDCKQKGFEHYHYKVQSEMIVKSIEGGLDYMFLSSINGDDEELEIKLKMAKKVFT